MVKQKETIVRKNTLEFFKSKMGTKDFLEFVDILTEKLPDEEGYRFSATSVAKAMNKEGYDVSPRTLRDQRSYLTNENE